MEKRAISLATRLDHAFVFPKYGVMLSRTSDQHDEDRNLCEWRADERKAEYQICC